MSHELLPAHSRPPKCPRARTADEEGNDDPGVGNARFRQFGYPDDVEEEPLPGDNRGARARGDKAPAHERSRDHAAKGHEQSVEPGGNRPRDLEPERQQGEARGVEAHGAADHLGER